MHSPTPHDDGPDELSDRLHDPISEAALLAIALHGRTAELLALPLDAITNPRHAVVAQVVRSRVARNLPVTPEIVLWDVDAGTEGVNTKATMRKLVIDLIGRFTFGEHAPYLAERLANLHTARTVGHAVARFGRDVNYAVVHDDMDLLTDGIKRVRESLDTAETTLSALPPTPPMSLGEMLDSPEPEYAWLVPDLLERGDRVVLTGFEGTGKSVLTAQMAICVAAGLHPFTGNPLPGLDGGTLRTLIFDVENSFGQLRRRYARMRFKVDAIRRGHDLAPVDWYDVVRVESRPEGVDLSDPRELARIESACATTAPDLVVGGPLYKMTGDSILEEQGAKNLTDTLDRLRVRHDFALILEGHAGHAQNGSGGRSLRPIGASLFLRWSEFGWGIRAHPDHADEKHPRRVVVSHWRGERDERAWPRELVHGSSTDLPWAVTGDYWRLLDDREHLHG